MPGTVHLLVGAALAVLIPDQPLMVVLAFFSHYLLDLLPHIDPETFAEKFKPYTWWQRAMLSTDIILIAALLLALFWLRSQPFQYLLGATVAQLPDLMSPLESYSVFFPLKAIHQDMFHWDKTRARRWSWYIAALLIPIAISAACLFTIWNERI